MNDEGSRHPEKAAAVRIGSAAVIASVGSAVSVIVTLARSKATAVLLGPVGLGRMAEMLQVVTLFLIPLGLASGPAFIRAIARARDDKQGAKQRVYDATCTALVAGGFGLTVAAFVVGSVIFTSPESGRLILLGALGMTIGAVVALPGQVLMIAGDMSKYSGIVIVSAVVSGATIVVATLMAGLKGQFAAMVIGPILVLAVLGRYYRRFLPDLRLWPTPRFDSSLFVEWLSVGSVSLISGLTMQGALSAIRALLNARCGVGANGQFQAAWSMDATYLLVLAQGLANVTGPRYAVAKDSDALRAEVEAATRFVFRVVPPFILVVLAFRDWAVRILTSSQFDIAASMAGYQMTGDLAKVLAWSQAGPLLYRGRVKAFFVSEGIAALLLTALPLAMVLRFGVVGAGFGIGIAYMLYVVVSKVALQVACGVTLSWRPTAAAIGFGVALWVLLILGDGSLWWRLLLVLTSVSWAWKAHLFTAANRFVRSRLRP